MFRRTFSFKEGDGWWIIFLLEGFTQYIQKSGTTSLTSTTQWWVYRSTLKNKHATCEVTLQGATTYPLLKVGTFWVDENPQSHQLEIVRLSSSWRTLALPVRQSESSACGDASGTCTVHVGFGGRRGGVVVLWYRVEGCEMLGCVKATLKEGNKMIQTNKREEVLRVFSLVSPFSSTLWLWYTVVFRLLVYNWYVLLPVFSHFFGGVPAFPSSTPPRASIHRPPLCLQGVALAEVLPQRWWQPTAWFVMTHDVSVFFFVLGAFGKGKEIWCSFWMEMVLVVVIVLIGKKPCWSGVFGHPLLVPLGASQPEDLHIFGSSCTGVPKTSGSFRRSPSKHEFRGYEVLKENHLESSVVMEIIY